MSNFFTSNEITQIIYLYNTGKSLATIAEQFNTTASTVKKYLNLNNVQCRSLSKAIRTYTLNEDAFTTLDDTGRYWLGFLSADGCIHDNRDGIPARCSIELKSSDIQHLYKFQEYIGTNKPVYNLPKTNTVRSEVSSQRLIGDLVNLGVTPRKSVDIKISEDSLHSRDFWRGMIDGDGCIGNSRYKGTIIKKISLCGTPSTIICFHTYLTHDLRIITNAKPQHVTDNFNIIEISGYNAVKIMYHLYNNANVYLERKHKLYQNIIQQLIEKSTTPHPQQTAIRSTLDYCRVTL